MMLVITTPPKSIAKSTLLLEKVTRSHLPSQIPGEAVQLSIEPEFKCLAKCAGVVKNMLLFSVYCEGEAFY